MLKIYKRYLIKLYNYSNKHYSIIGPLAFTIFYGSFIIILNLLSVFLLMDKYLNVNLLILFPKNGFIFLVTWVPVIAGFHYLLIRSGIKNIRENNYPIIVSTMQELKIQNKQLFPVVTPLIVTFIIFFTVLFVSTNK